MASALAGRAGVGYDAHRLVPGRALVLGGVRVPYELGLEGHSDADVLVHAVIDALLGAAGAGDIGRHFAPGDPAHKDAFSLSLLAAVGALVRERGYAVANVDATILAEEPQLEPYAEAMCRNLAGALGVETERVNVKATTLEGMGFVGRKEGLAALAVALLAPATGEGRP